MSSIISVRHPQYGTLRWRLVIVHLAAMFCQTVHGVDMQGVRLQGTPQGSDYLPLHSPIPQVMQCVYRAAYDDIVTQVSWKKDGNTVYEWTAHQTLPNVSPGFSLIINTNPPSSPQHLHFQNISNEITGNYTCSVTSSKGVAESEEFSVVVIDVPTEGFVLNVTGYSDFLMENKRYNNNNNINNNNNNDDNFNVSINYNTNVYNNNEKNNNDNDYNSDGDSLYNGDNTTNPTTSFQQPKTRTKTHSYKTSSFASFFSSSSSSSSSSTSSLSYSSLTPNPNCSLVWTFSTPLMYPRPNVTCGLYSYVHDDVTVAVPAGLVMHGYNNGSWKAFFKNTLVKIEEMPRKSRLGCSIGIPNTSFKRVFKFEDGFAIDHLIDEEGCPSLRLDPSHHLRMEVFGGIHNCRGDYVPLDVGEPVRARFSCGIGAIATFPNGSRLYDWWQEATCSPRDLAWRGLPDFHVVGSDEFSVMVLSGLPICVGGRPLTSGNENVQSSFSLCLAVYCFTSIIIKHIFKVH